MKYNADLWRKASAYKGLEKSASTASSSRDPANSAPEVDRRLTVGLALTCAMPVSAPPTAATRRARGADRRRL